MVRLANNRLAEAAQFEVSETMDETDRIAVQHVADALVEILDNPAADEIAAGVYESSPKVAYAALCYVAEAITREQFLAAMREAA